jgi:hypothetical protein
MSDKLHFVGNVLPGITHQNENGFTQTHGQDARATSW